MQQETVIGFRVKLKGNDKLVESLNLIPVPLEQTVDAIKEIEKRAKTFDLLTKKLKALNVESAKLAKTLGKANTGGSGTRKSPIADEQERIQKEAKETARTLGVIKKEIKALGDEGGVEYKKLVKEAATLRKESLDLNKAIRVQQREFEEAAAAAGSYRQLNAEVGKLRDTFRGLSKEDREGPLGKETLKRVGLLDKELKEIDAQMGIYVRNVGNYSSAWKGLTSVVQQFGGLVGIVASADEIISENARISDSIADVSKTTDLTTKSLNDLVDNLKFRDTRTSLADQLGIAEIGGRAGILKEFLDNGDIDGATKELEKFVGAIDIANVALGDQFGDAENVASTLQGIRNVLGSFQTDDTADDLLKIGNALNFLETQGNATAPVIADLVGRIGGTTGPLGVAADEVFGIATALDELEVRAERGGTAVSTIFQRLAQEPADFALVAGVAAEEFTELVNTDITGALLKFLDGLEKVDDNTQFAATLKGLKLSGSGASEVLGKLSENTDLLRERITQAGEALNSTASLTAEFEKKNVTLGAAIDKVKNSFINLVVQGQFQEFLAGGITGIARFVNALAAVPIFIKENRVEIGLLLIAVAALNTQLIAAQVAILRKAAAEKAALIATKATTAAQWLLNAALTANPIGLVVAAVAILTAGLVKLYRESETVRNGINDATKTFLDFIDSNVLLQFSIGLIIAPIRLLYGLLTDGKGFVTEFVASFRDGFSRVVLQAQKLAKNVRLALTIDTQTRQRLEAELLDIEQSLINIDKRAAERQVKKIKADAKSAAEEVEQIKLAEKKKQETRVNIRKATAQQLKLIAEGEDKILAKQAKDEIKRREEVAEVARKTAEERLEAAKKIEDLQNSSINNSFDKQSAQATTSANRDISGLSGSPEQIREQTALIKTALAEQISEIEKAREDAQDKALEQVREYQSELKAIQADSGVDAVENDFSILESSFKIDTANINANFLEAKSLLNQQLADQLITQQQYQEQLKTLELQNKEELLQLQREKAAEEGQLEQDLALAKREQLRVQLDEELQTIREAAANRREELQTQRDEEAITEQQYQEGLKAVKDLQRQQEIDAERAFREQEAVLVEEVALKSIEQSQSIAEQEVAINKEKNDRILEQEKKTASQTQAIQQARLTLLSTFVGGVKNLLGQDEANRKRYGGILKALALAEIAINLQKELSAIAAAAAANPANAVTAGVVGISQYAIQSAIAVARSAFAAAQIISRKFEYGGAIGADGSITAASGESGQSVPVNSGFALGSPHTSDGVKIKNRYGDLMEIEGGEYMMRNGKETYIINSKSARKFKSQLLSNSSYPHRYSSNRRKIASMVNSYNGWGIPFAREGGISGPNGFQTINGNPLAVQPLAAPQLESLNLNRDESFARELNMQNAMIADYIGAVDEKIDAVNSRVDRLVVINDPSETVNLGNDIIQTQNESQL